MVNRDDHTALLAEADRTVASIRIRHGPDAIYKDRCPECHFTRLPCDPLDDADLIERLATALREAEKERGAIAEAAAAVTQYVGCGDNSCRFVTPKGMATNGGCRCERRPGVMTTLAKLYRAALAPEPGHD